VLHWHFRSVHNGEATSNNAMLAQYRVKLGGKRLHGSLTLRDQREAEASHQKKSQNASRAVHTRIIHAPIQS
jgi:hypothetical protein